MTLRLILTRHAKSSWDDPRVQDHARALNDRGRRSATAIGRWLENNGHAPDLVLCSTALRTRETWAIIADEIAATPEVRYEKTLYAAPAERMLSLLQSLDGRTTVMILGHNPGSAMLAGALAAAPPPHPQFHRYPTAATTVFAFDADEWRDVGWNSGRIIDFVVPRDLI